MGFADRYIQRNISYPAFVEESPSGRLGMAIVIPVFNEPDLLQTICSLAECQAPKQTAEVFVVINQSEKSPPEITQQNQRTIDELKVWKEQNNDVFFALHVIKPPPFRKKHAGAGLARKTGMDEAVRRFAAIEKED
ncbi:MAG TPA: glycosyltransferase, partial [Sunxiuqinia sp.]|nr:glycosyltransferase [Sunxiuqinia sp.]